MTACVMAHRRQTRADLCEFNASFINRVKSKITRTYIDPGSKKKKKVKIVRMDWGESGYQIKSRTIKLKHYEYKSCVLLRSVLKVILLTISHIFLGRIRQERE